jgi:hypothetical protein
VIVFAHLGHLLIDIPLYGGPVILLMIAFGVSTLRERRRSSLVGHRDQPEHDRG